MKVNLILGRKSPQQANLENVFADHANIGHAAGIEPTTFTDLAAVPIVE